MAERVKDSRQPWYDDAFQQDYLARYFHRSDEAALAELPFLLSALALPRGRRVLDVCCGAGRHSRALKLCGYGVVAFDRSLDLLKQAQSLQTAGLSIRYLRADMRRLPLADRSVDGAVNLFTSFGYFPQDADNARVIAEVSRVLKPGAPFVLDFFNLHTTLRRLVRQSEKRVGCMRLLERREYDRRRKRLNKTTRVVGGRKVEIRRESVRAYSPAELAALCERAGLQIVARFGDLFGTPFDADTSPRCVLLARKTARRQRAQAKRHR